MVATLPKFRSRSQPSDPQEQALNPDDWNYHRQDWSFTPGEAGAKWMEKFQKLEEPYYPKLELKPKGKG